jgi:hypothetical protein
MGFTRKQISYLKRTPLRQNISTRDFHGRSLQYLEGWFAVSEANRIFGFDGWSRETIETRCVFARESRGSFVAVYIAKVKITVQAGELTLVREGHGTNEARGDSLGEVHDTALKAAETDATKRALATFGRPFGLELYRSGKSSIQQQARHTTVMPSPPVASGAHPDDTTPIPRPSRYYGRGPDEIANHFQQERKKAAKDISALPQSVISDDIPKTTAYGASEKIDKSQLALGEPKRLRDKAHLRFVASKPCLVCARQPSDPHHLRFAQPRALGLKVSDEFTVPLCRIHHRQLHSVGDERTWWGQYNISPLEVAKTLWEQTRPNSTRQKNAAESIG